MKQTNRLKQTSETTQMAKTGQNETESLKQTTCYIYWEQTG